MGRYLKNRELKSASYSIRLPMGSDVVGPNSPVTGLVRFNQIKNDPQIFLKNKWRNFLITDDRDVEPSKDTFFGDGSTTNFGPMRYSYQPGEEILILVHIGNVFQNPGVAYVLLDTTISFTSPPPMGHAIVILHGFAR